MACSQGLSSASLVSWPIKKIEDFNTASVLFVENNNMFEATEDFRDSSENNNIKFLGEMVNFIHKCSLKPNYIARGIVSSFIEGDIVQFKPLDHSEFGILIQKVFRYCEECGLSEVCLIRWPTNHLLDLNDVPLDDRLKMNTKEDMVNFWNIFEEFPLQMVLPGESISDDVKINTTRPYSSVKQ